MAAFLHSARIIYYENGFLKKELLPQVKTEIVKFRSGFTILPLKLMDKHAIATEKESISKFFLNKYKYFYQNM